jgi:hypothetical protein
MLVALDIHKTNALHSWSAHKLQWLEDPNQSSADNLNKVRHETSRHYRNEIKEHVKGIIK